MQCLGVLQGACIVWILWMSVSVTVTWNTAIGIVLLIAATVARELMTTSIVSIETDHNPLKGKPSSKSKVAGDVLNRVNQQISDLVSYDAEKCQSVVNVQLIVKNTECIFAKSARIWGSRDWDYNLTLEQNVERCLPMFLKFSLLCEPLGLDAFIYELPGPDHASDIQVFANRVRRVLQTLSDHDPSSVHCMNKSYVGKRGWVFEYCQTTMFVTTFAPFYPESHSRYSFGTENGYIFFQPEISFAQRDISPDTIHTKWDNPQSDRDRIRVGFRNAGREYCIRDTLYYPMAHDIVKPVELDGEIIQWWSKDTKSNNVNDEDNTIHNYHMVTSSDFS